MGFGSFFTRALDVVTPWDRGGEIQRRTERKRREDEERWQQSQPQAPGGLRVGVAQPNQQITLPKPQKPVNIFEDLNKNLVFNKPQNTLRVTNAPNTQRIKLPDGRYADEIPDTPEQIVTRGLDRGESWEDIARKNKLDLGSVREFSQTTRPNYGIKVEKPKQSFWNKARDIFDANTEADKFRRYQGNVTKGEDKPITLQRPGNIVSKTPIVGHITKLLNTMGTQGAEIIPTTGQFFATREYTAATDEYVAATKSGDRNRIAKAKQRLEGAADRLKDYNYQIDAAKTMYRKNDGGLFNAGTLYDEEGSRRGDVKTALKDIAAPTAVTALDLYTLGRGSAISEGIKTGGVRTALRMGPGSQLPNIIKATAGNYASGDIGTRAEGGTNEQAIKSGLLNSILGIVPDVGLPIIGKGFKNKVLPKLLRGRGVDPKVAVEELDDAAISASAEAANQAMRPRPIPVRSNIPIREVSEGLSEVPVRVTPKPQGEIIREIGGDATEATTNNAIVDRAARIRREGAEAVNNVPVDRRIEGVTPRAPERPFALTPEDVVTGQDKVVQDYADLLRDLGEGNGVAINRETGTRMSNNYRPGMGSGRVSKAEWLEEARRQLESGKAEETVQKAFNDAADPEVQALLAKGEQLPVEDGRPIDVRQVNSIPVTDQTVVPTNLPETPGTVRVTESTAPSNAKSELVAAQPTVALPREVQEVLDNPKQFNKRQVAAARNQRKLARQMAKTQEQTAEALDRIQTVSPAAASGEGFVPTGEFAKGKNGVIQRVHRATEMAQAVEETANMSPGDIIQTARKNQMETGGFTPRDMRNVRALAESKRIFRGTPEYNELKAILAEDGTVWGQQGALRNYTMRRTASADELVNRYESKIYRLADDPTKIKSSMFDEVEVAETAYAQARDDAMAAYNRFTENPTSANAKAYHAAQDAAEKADKAAKITEYRIADKVLKGNKDVKQVRTLEKMANDADMYQMDAVDASMLSGTGTFVRNFVNAAVGGTEEGLFGGVASRIARKLTGQNVGGGVGKGTVKGFGEGVENIVDASKARAGNAGKNPLQHIKNWATTGNQLGDTVIDSQARHNVIDHYTQVLKDQGFSGRELADRASVMARQDPDDLGRVYTNAARTAAGLGGGITRNNKIETIVKNMISDGISGGNPTRLTEGAAKLITRMTLGFPTAIGRSLGEGVKRFTLGAPTFIKALRTPDAQARAILIKEGIKQGGSGALVIPPLFYAMGANDMITGAYPKDPEERARWEREGITENSVRIGDAYYQLPAYLGSWAVPGLFYASLGRNDGDWAAAAADTAKIVPAILPTDQASNWLDVVNGRTDMGKFMAQTGAGAVRAVTPAGALLNQLAKSLDPTKNDTTSGTNWENFVDKVLGGIPIVNNMADIPDKVDDSGNVIQNASPLELGFGAASAAQGAGEQRSAEITGEINDTIKGISDLGLLDDPNLNGVLEGTSLEALNKLKTGKQLDESEVKALKEGLVKGVSSEGTDTAYLERGQYDTNLAVLKLKRELMNSDPTVKPSSLKDIDTAIKRGEVFKDNKIPYDFIKLYQDTSNTEWRNMGDPEDEDYDPETYEKLWQMDQLMTKAKVSENDKGDLEKSKYSAKTSGSGRGGRGGRGPKNLDTSFGTLKQLGYAPRVQEYAGIDAKAGTIPYIRTVRPNIVHKITASR